VIIPIRKEIAAKSIGMTSLKISPKSQNPTRTSQGTSHIVKKSEHVTKEKMLKNHGRKGKMVL